MRIDRCLAVAVLGALLVGAPDATRADGSGEGFLVELIDALVDADNAWLEWYGDLPPFWQRVLEPAAVKVAKSRRPRLKLLIDIAPERALEDRLGHAERAGLPAAVSAPLEALVDGSGNFQAAAFLHMFDAQTGSTTSSITESVLTVGDLSFVAPSLYGRRANQASKNGLPVHGIAIDGSFAWSEQPYRFLDPLELTENQVPPGLIGLFVGDGLEIVPTADDVDELIEFLIFRESFPGPDLIDLITDPNPSEGAWTNGEKTLLWLPVDFEEVSGSRFERSPTTDLVISDAREWLEAISRGRTTITETYFPEVLRLGPGSLARANAATSSVVDDAIAALADYDAANGGTGMWLPSSFDRIAILVSDALTLADGTIARGAFTANNKNMVFFGVTDRFFMQHELGHTYLFGHSDYLRADTSDPVGPGTTFFVPWDYMGLAAADGDNRQHPPSYYKDQAFWFEGSEVLDASFGGRFRILSHDRGPPEFVRALRIITPDREYWVDMRRLWPEVPLLHNGVQIHYTRPRAETLGVRFVTAVAPRPLVPATQSPFVAGETFEDTARGVRITINATGMDPLIFGAFFADITVERF